MTSLRERLQFQGITISDSLQEVGEMGVEQLALALANVDYVMIFDRRRFEPMLPMLVDLMARDPKLMKAHRESEARIRAYLRRTDRLVGR